MDAIEQWAVRGDDRLVGFVRSPEGRFAPRLVVTSPVVGVRLKGNPPIPIALTSSGSEYWLGQPAYEAQTSPKQFVAQKLKQAQLGQPGPMDATVFVHV